MKRDFMLTKSLCQWLEKLKMSHLLYNFINNAIDDYEWILLMMNTPLELSSNMLMTELSIEDENERNILLSNLRESSKLYLGANLAVKYGLYRAIQDTTVIHEKTCSCIVF